MNAGVDAWPALLLWGLNALLPGLLLLIAGKAPWGLLIRNRLEQLFFGFTVLLGLLWSMRAGVRPGLDMHLLGMTLATLVFGWRLAVASGSLALAGLTLSAWLGLQSVAVYSIPAFAVNAVILVLVPTLVSRWTGALAYRWLPHNLFVYVFVSGFVAGILALAAAALSAVLFWLAFGPYPLQVLLDEFLVIVPLLAFPEGFITGATITMLVVFRPDWVRTFDDRDYIDQR